MPRHIYILPLLISLSVGCEDSLSAEPFVSDAEFLKALPTSDDYTLVVARLDDDWSGPEPLPGSEDGWVDLLEISRDVATSLNDITLSCLSFVDTVSETSPSYRSATARRWGPIVEGDWTMALDMTRDQDAYSWDFRAMQGDDERLPSICAGIHDPGTERWSEGRGVFDVWLDNWSDLGGAIGTLETKYDLTDGKELRINIVGLGEVGGRAEDGAYYFRQESTGAGDFQYRTTLLLDGRLEAKVEVRTRWNADGTGRSDARLTGEDLSRVYRFSECFEGRNKVWRWTDYDSGAEQGDESDCAFESAAATDQI